jgi:hypothetical protein
MNNQARIQKELERAASTVTTDCAKYRQWLAEAAVDIWQSEVQHAAVKTNVNQRINQHLAEIPGLEQQEQ